MNYIKQNHLSILIILFLVISPFFAKPVPVVSNQFGAAANVTTFTNPIVFANTVTHSSTLTQTGLVTLDGGSLHSYNLSTSTPASLTLAVSDLLNYSSVTMKPTVGAITVTFPASSTLSTLVPSAGDIQNQCWYNATTTAASTITFAASTGLDLEIASSTISAPGTISLILGADNSACFSFQRKGAGPNASDITVRFLRYVDGD